MEILGFSLWTILIALVFGVVGFVELPLVSAP